MLNEQLRRTPPVWAKEVDDGGMFPTRLTVHRDPDEGGLRFLAVCTTGWGGGAQARRATLAEAIAHTEKLHRKVHG